MAAVLSLYETWLIREVTDPRTGISTDSRYCDYMPNSGQLKIYCDELRARRERYAHLGSLKRQEHVALPPDTRPGRRANVFVPADSNQYAKAMRLIETADAADWKADEQGRYGIWISLNLLDGPPLKKSNEASRMRVPSDDELRSFYGSRGAAE